MKVQVKRTFKLRKLYLLSTVSARKIRLCLILTSQRMFQAFQISQKPLASEQIFRADYKRFERRKITRIFGKY